MTSIDLASIVYKIVKLSKVDEITGGGVYIGERPLNSKKNDTVVQTISVDGGQLQFGSVNVQIFAQNIHQANTSMPNLNTLNNAVKHLKPLLKDLYLSKEQVYINIESERYYKVDNAQEWVAVMKLETRSVEN